MSKKQIHSINKNLVKQEGRRCALVAYIKQLDALCHSIDATGYIAKRAVNFPDNREVTRTLETNRNDIRGLLADAEFELAEVELNMSELKDEKEKLEEKA